MWHDIKSTLQHGSCSLNFLDIVGLVFGKSFNTGVTSLLLGLVLCCCFLVHSGCFGGSYGVQTRESMHTRAIYFIHIYQIMGRSIVSHGFHIN